MFAGILPVTFLPPTLQDPCKVEIEDGCCCQPAKETMPGGIMPIGCEGASCGVPGMPCEDGTSYFVFSRWKDGKCKEGNMNLSTNVALETLIILFEGFIVIAPEMTHRNALAPRSQQL